MCFQCFFFFLFLFLLQKHIGGQIVDVGLGQRMHLFCKGHGNPVGKSSSGDSVLCVKHDIINHCCGLL